MDPSLLTLRSFQWLRGFPDFPLSTGIPALLQVRSLLLLDPHLLLRIKNPFDPQKSSEQTFQQGKTGGIIPRPFFLGKVALGHSSSKDFSFSAAAPDVALFASVS